MKGLHSCRYQDCNQSFDHCQKRARHEATHKKNKDAKIKKEYRCVCCSPSLVFESARQRRNHQHYIKNRNSFQCSLCFGYFATAQKLEDHKHLCEVKNNVDASDSNKEDEEEEEEEEEETKETHRSFKSKSPKKECDDCGRDLRKHEHFVGRLASLWNCPYCKYTKCESCHTFLQAHSHLVACATRSRNRSDSGDSDVSE